MFRTFQDILELLPPEVGRAVQGRLEEQGANSDFVSLIGLVSCYFVYLVNLVPPSPPVCREVFLSYPTNTESLTLLDI